MSFASALNILHRALPYHLALAKYDLLHITRNSFELRPHPAAPPIALELAATCFAMGASSCIESFVMSRTLGPWLQAEFGWSRRTAENFISVAETFHPKSEIIANLTILPTAAYLLAAPSVPEKARQEAIERAEGGEKITTVVAKEIVAEAKKASPRRPRKLPTEKLSLRLRKLLDGYKKRWNPDGLSELARQLREFAEALESQRGGRRK